MSLIENLIKKRLIKKREGSIIEWESLPKGEEEWWHFLIFYYSGLAVIQRGSSALSYVCSHLRTLLRVTGNQ